MKIAIAQENPTVGDLAGNRQRIHEAIAAARDEGCQLVIFPELALTGYPPRDLLERRGFIRDVGRAVERLARETPAGITAVVGAVEENPAPEGRHLFNSALVIEGGKVRTSVRKRLLPTYDVFDEDRYFEPAPEQEVVHVGGVPIGLTICEDMWNAGESRAPSPPDAGAPPSGQRLHHRVDPIADAARKGARILVNISASPYHRGKVALRHELIRSHARRHGLPFLFANQVGGNDDLVFDGSSCALDAQGRIGARARDFAPDLLVVDVDPERGTVSGPGRSTSPGLTAEVWNALVLGTRDYARKCGFKEALLGVSGGIDSALVAAIACEALGPANVLGVSMPSRFSSRGSKDDARDLCANLGMPFQTIAIEPMYASFLGALEDSFKGLPRDVTEENIQARIRGTVLMALSNKRSGLLLTTGNKSELATGYCTLYGDMAGGLAVISDVPKMLVYELSRYANREREAIPLASIEKPPSAELRENQKDEDSLPPYPVLDAILELYVDEAREPGEIVARGFPAPVVADVARMVERAEYKRKQMPPGLKVTSKAFGVGRRYPIAKRLTTA